MPTPSDASPLASAPSRARRPALADGAPVALGDGRTVEVRPICPGDAPLLADFHRALSEETVHLRYGGGFGLDSRASLDRLGQRCRAGDGEVVLVAVHQAPDGPALLAVGRLVRLDAGAAEFALVVRDDAQGLGLGTEILRRLVEAGRREGHGRLVGVILPENGPMQRVARALGFTVRGVPGDTTAHAVLSLDDVREPPGPSDGGPYAIPSRPATVPAP